MNRYITLVRFEIKKLFQRKIFWVTFAVLGVFQVIMASAYFFGSYYVEGELYETHSEQIAIERKNGEALSGQKLDDTLLEKAQGAMRLQAKLQAQAAENGDSKNTYGIESAAGGSMAYLFTEEYENQVRPYNEVNWYIQSFVFDSELDPTTVTAEELYDVRQQTMEAIWENYELSESEKAYWSDKEEQVSKPFVYQYAQSYNDLISMSGVYFVSMIMTFFIAICLSGIFTDEHGSRMDQLILCAKMGRKHAYYSKIIAGVMVSIGVTIIYILIVSGIKFLLFGNIGFDAMLQLLMPYVSLPLSVGQIFLISVGILILSNVMITCFTVVFAEIIRNNIGAMAVVIAMVFLARLGVIPQRLRVFSQIWNYIPINLLKIDQGMTDYRLVSVFGIQMTSLQLAPVLYVILTVVLIWIGKKVYCNYQVGGR